MYYNFNNDLTKFGNIIERLEEIIRVEAFSLDVDRELSAIKEACDDFYAQVDGLHDEFCDLEEERDKLQEKLDEISSIVGW